MQEINKGQRGADAGSLTTGVTDEKSGFGGSSQRCNFRGVGVMTAIYADRAENAEIWDIEGNRYIDFAAGIAVVNTGHRHPKVMAAVKDQLEHFTHTCHQVIPYENYVRLAERLNAAVPATSPRRRSL